MDWGTELDVSLNTQLKPETTECGCRHVNIGKQEKSQLN